jgi:zinc/manganese transport system permease protein
LGIKAGSDVSPIQLNARAGVQVSCGGMFAYEFVRNAYLAGTFIALVCGLIGWFVVLRGQVFAGDALSHVAFTGAVAAAAIGIDPRIGLFAATILLAGVIAGLGRRAAADDVTIGTVFSWILGLGVFFVTLAATSSGGGESAITAANTLFGSIFGLDAAAARLAAAIAIAATVGLLVIARPLLFASIDRDVARAHGVRIRALGIAFLLLVGIIAGEATQAVGALLLLGLLAAPAGAASKLTANPWVGLALSAAIAVGSMWGGLALSYQIASLPPSTAILLIAAGTYLLASAVRSYRQRRPQTTDAPAATVPSLPLPPL